MGRKAHHRVLAGVMVFRQIMNYTTAMNLHVK